MPAFWSPTVHDAVVLVHILAAVFWLGWMVFMFGLLRPVLGRLVPERTPDILGAPDVALLPVLPLWDRLAEI